MKNYLSYHFKTFAAPKLDEGGNITYAKDGSTIYVNVTADECFNIARRMSNGDIYSLPWSYDFDYDQDRGFLCLLNPNDPTCDNKKIANLSGSSLKKMLRNKEKESICFSIDETFRNDKDGDMECRFEPDAGIDIERDAEVNDCLGILFDALAKLERKKSEIYLQHKRGTSQQKLAEQYGYASKNSIARIIAEVDAALRANPALKDYFNCF